MTERTCGSSHPTSLLWRNMSTSRVQGTSMHPLDHVKLRQKEKVQWPHISGSWCAQFAEYMWRICWPLCTNSVSKPCLSVNQDGTHVFTSVCPTGLNLNLSEPHSCPRYQSRKQAAQIQPHVSSGQHPSPNLRPLRMRHPLLITQAARALCWQLSYL